ncbi:MAG: thioredoxin fold domain-containing protein [Pseudomonadota bacterium]|nr:MAG: thioredoxin fold domain-containing protein [Pseudomonadota bacterium]
MLLKSYLVAGLVSALTWVAAQADPQVPGTGVADRAGVHVAQTTDLQHDAHSARERDLPILMMFSMDGCPYCVLVEEDFLRPMLISGDYQDKVIIRMVKTDTYGNVRDFDGRAVDVDEFAQRYRAFVMPTVVLVDHRGRELAPRLVGISTPDFYGGDLDDAIDTALGRLRQFAMHRGARAATPAN